MKVSTIRNKTNNTRVITVEFSDFELIEDSPTLIFLKTLQRSYQELEESWDKED